jgi:hypothetical protein
MRKCICVCGETFLSTDTDAALIHLFATGHHWIKLSYHQQNRIDGGVYAETERRVEQGSGTHDYAGAGTAFSGVSGGVIRADGNHRSDT